MNCVLEHGEKLLSYCSQEEYLKLIENGVDCSFLFCAKIPFHQQMVGYTGNLDKTNKEYLYAYRPEKHSMALNMVDAPKKEFFSDEMIQAGLQFIEQELCSGRDVVVVCNKGESRSATMCLLYMIEHGRFSNTLTHTRLFEAYKMIAPNWNPGNGILQYTVDFWTKYKQEGHK